MALETIKEYLIGLGFSVNQTSYDQANKAIDTLEQGISGFANSFVKGLGKAAAAYVAFGTAAASASAKFLNGLAQQQINVEILSRQLWTSQQNAMAFSATLKSMGANLQDLYLSPTLMNQYQQLHSAAMEMTTPGDYNQQIQQIQNIRVQFEKMKLEAYYSLQWVGYWFVKYMDGPITNVHNILQQINAVIIKQMPNWTKKAAQWMASFWQAGVQIAQGLHKVWNGFKKLSTDIPTWAKAIGGALALIAISNPFMLFVEGIAAAILLWNDWQTYLKDPSKSAFPKLWSWVDKLNKKLSDLNIGQQIGNDIKTAFDGLGQTFQNVWGFLKNLYKTFNDNGTISQFENNINSLWDATQSLFWSIGDLITAIGNLYANMSNQQGQSGLTSFFQMIADLGNTAIQIVTGAIYSISFLAQAISDVLNGKFKDAANLINLIDGAGGTLPQNLVPKTGGYTTQGGYGPSSYPYMWGTTGGLTSNTTNSSTTKTNQVTVNAPVTNYITGSGNPYAAANAVGQSVNRVWHSIQPAWG